MTARPALAALTAALGCALVAGCSPFASEEPTTTPPPSTTTSSTPTDRLHQVYSRGQLVEALPGYGDLGDGWRRPGNEYLTEISDPENISPTQCAALILRGESWEQVEGTVVGQTSRRYAKGEEEFAYIEMYSFQDPFPGAVFDEVESVTSQCGTWRYSGSTYTATPLTLPTFGDRSFGQRYVVAGKDPFTLESLRFAVGHTLVTISVSAPETPDNDALRDAADSILTTLRETP